MTLKLNKTLFAITSLFALAAHAEQRVPATEQVPHVVSVSKQNLSRIAIDGGKISTWKFMEGDLEVTKDSNTSQLFVRSLTSRPTNLFIISDEGKTYLLVLKPSLKQGDNIIIDEARISRQEAILAATNTGPMPVTSNSSAYIRSIKQLMVSMMNGSVGSMGLRQQSSYQTIPLWKNTLFVQTGQYTAADMQARSYKLTNIGTEVLNFREQEFYRPNVYAVSARKQVLQPGEMTEVFVISKLGGN